MNLAQLLDQLKADERFLRNVTRWEVIPPEAGRYAEFPSTLDPRLVAVRGDLGGLLEGGPVVGFVDAAGMFVEQHVRVAQSTERVGDLKAILFQPAEKAQRFAYRQRLHRQVSSFSPVFVIVGIISLIAQVCVFCNGRRRRNQNSCNVRLSLYNA